eukprot:CAMPEP_0113588510 /NCGR_PEP_ID=MMETSP0015_2-20120614/35553_1 /TAXON_ID=2838 /ORGANISM="Odontella" /LENGTH=61 /DNA_ID=CAMNT_0000494387 /DNA_START=33 /DNA_END=214 /DNA_ORIENTATION=+ /assembly_acc=CAM_ASM_000160
MRSEREKMQMPLSSSSAPPSPSAAPSNSTTVMVPSGVGVSSAISDENGVSSIAVAPVDAFG